jgi:hypothetical protein
LSNSIPSSFSTSRLSMLVKGAASGNAVLLSPIQFEPDDPPVRNQVMLRRCPTARHTPEQASQSKRSECETETPPDRLTDHICSRTLSSRRSRPRRGGGLSPRRSGRRPGGCLGGKSSRAGFAGCTGSDTSASRDLVWKITGDERGRTTARTLVPFASVSLSVCSKASMHPGEKPASPSGTCTGTSLTRARPMRSRSKPV